MRRVRSLAALLALTAALGVLSGAVSGQTPAMSPMASPGPPLPLLPAGPAREGVPAGPAPSTPVPASGSDFARSAPAASLSAGTAAPRNVPPGVPGTIFPPCPRGLLYRLLAEATTLDDAVAALGLESEAIRLCTARQRLLAELHAADDELHQAQRPEPAPAASGPVAPVPSPGPAPMPAAEATTPAGNGFEGTLSRIDTLLQDGVSVDGDRAAVRDDDDVPLEAGDDALELPGPYRWFTILGRAGALRAGLARDGERWFVAAGDQLPGGARVARIATDPPGVWLAGTPPEALPHGPPPRAGPGDGGAPIGEDSAP